VWFLRKRPIYPEGECTLADELRIGLSELLRKATIEQDAGFLKEGVRVLSQALMEMEVQEHVGAAPQERSAERGGQRNGYRGRSWDTRVGTVELKVPRVRDSSYFPSLLEPRRRAERASLPLSWRPTCTRTVTIVALQASGYYLTRVIKYARWPVHQAPHSYYRYVKWRRMKTLN
jgi:hypothetical protein